MAAMRALLLLALAATASAKPCDYENLCLELIDGTWWGVIIEIWLIIYTFVGIAKVADAHLAPGLEVLCKRWSIPDDVAGASFLALGSAAPEIIISVVSTIKQALYSHKLKAAGQASALAISSIVGSGMMAFTLIPGLCAMAVDEPMKLTRRPLARDAVFFSLSLWMLVSCIADGVVDLTEAVTMLVLYAVYLLVLVFAPGMRMCCKGTNPSLTETLNPEGDAEKGGDDDDDDDEEEEKCPGPLDLFFKPLYATISLTCPECELGKDEDKYPIALIMAFLWLAIMSTALSAALTRLGELLHLPIAIMGMYVVAVGAQVPDTFQAIAVAKRGHGSMAVASATASQVINILIGLGVPWTLSAALTSRPTLVPDHAVLTSMSSFLAVCVIMYVGCLLLPTIPTWGKKGRSILGKGQGYFLFTVYVVCVVAYAAATWAGWLMR